MSCGKASPTGDACQLLVELMAKRLKIVHPEIKIQWSIISFPMLFDIVLYYIYIIFYHITL